MSSLIGLGVLGTFGQPFGFQQTFYLGVDATGSLDLDEDIIEVYPGNELFGVKRELVDGVNTISFCIYSYIKELYSDRISTFIGTCVVLHDGYAEADYIYKLLREFNNNVKNEPKNISDHTIIVQQAQNLVVREPDSFKAVQANVIPLNKTPFSSTGVDVAKKILVNPEPGDTRDIDDQVIEFFNDALKYYTDADVVYFTRDEDVVRYTAKKDAIRNLGWNEFVAHKNNLQRPGVIRSKKGLRHTPPEDIVLPAGIPTTDEHYSKVEPLEEQSTTVHYNDDLLHNNTEPNAAEYNELTDSGEVDTDRPFDAWEEPNEGWSREEAREKVREYNRLFRYTNMLRANADTLAPKKGWKLGGRKANPKAQAPAPFFESAEDEPVIKPSLRHRLTGTKKKRGILLLVVLGILIIGGIVFNMFFDQGTQAKGPTIVGNVADAQPEAVKNVAMNTIDSAVKSAEPVRQDTAVLLSTPAAQPIARAHGDAAITTSSMPVNSASGKETINSIRKELAAKAPAEKIAALKGPDNAAATMQKDEPAGMTITALKPAPNFEISQKDVISWKEDIKDKTPLEVTRIIFQTVPTNIGNVYKGQEKEYADYFLSVNKHAFRKVEGEYICLANEVVLYIPAYKSPRGSHGK